MLSESNESLPIETLKNRLKLSNFALIVLWVGALFTFGAIIYKYFQEDIFETSTLVVVIIALLLSIPVFVNRGRIKKILKSRTSNN